MCRSGVSHGRVHSRFAAAEYALSLTPAPERIFWRQCAWADIYPDRARSAGSPGALCRQNPSIFDEEYGGGGEEAAVLGDEGAPGYAGEAYAVEGGPGMPRARMMLATIFIPFTMISVSIELKVSCIPMNQPRITIRLNVAGAAQTRI